MEQFSLEKYLENTNHKIVTRDGRPVKIAGTDDSHSPKCLIYGFVGDAKFITSWRSDGTHTNRMDSYDLFFADEEELSEFEKQLGVYIYFPRLSSGFNEEEKKYIKDAANTLLNLAKSELEENYYTKVLDDRMVFKSGLNATDSQTAYDMGKQDTLKSLPKWKKCDDNLPYSHIGGLNERYLIKNGYCIKISDLETLPKEE